MLLCTCKNGRLDIDSINMVKQGTSKEQNLHYHSITHTFRILYNIAGPQLTSGLSSLTTILQACRTEGVSSRPIHGRCV